MHSAIGRGSLAGGTAVNVWGIGAPHCTGALNCTVRTDVCCTDRTEATIREEILSYSHGICSEQGRDILL